MYTFIISLCALVAGYVFYGRYLEHVFGPDDRPTPAITHADGVDYVKMPYWKIFMIQFLNIAGTGPVFGALMGAKFGPVAYLWIVFGCIFAGAMHDYMSGMLSMRHNGLDLPTLIRKYLGKTAANSLMVFTVILMLMVGAVFVYSPAEILSNIWGGKLTWMAVIFIYYIIATMLPIDKVIGKIYPVFAVALIFMAVSLTIVLLVKFPTLPEIWDSFGNLGKLTHPDTFKEDIFPALCITIACGAISGFHATQSPMMARCIASEKRARPIFYGAMVTEGLVAVVWATIGMWFFYGSPQPGFETMAGAQATGYNTSAPVIVDIVCKDWLGTAGGILALLGVVAAPITTGDTSLRSARMIIAQAIRLDQRPRLNRLYVGLPIFALTFGMLVWQVTNLNGFNTLWCYVGWANQAMSVFTLWAITVYLAQRRKPFLISLIPALFMTMVCVTFLFVADIAFGLPTPIGFGIGAAAVVVTTLTFAVKFKSLRLPAGFEE